MTTLAFNTAYDINKSTRLYIYEDQEGCNGTEIAHGDLYSVDDKLDAHCLERVFTPSKPTIIAGKIVGYCLGALLFIPIVIISLFLSLIHGMSLKRYLAKYLILTAQKLSIRELKLSLLEGVKRVPEGVLCIEKRVKTPSGETLNGMSFSPNGFLDKPIEEQKWIVVMTGRRGAYEKKIDSYAKWASEMGVGVLAVNWKGVGSSEGKTNDAASMIEDGRAMVWHLLGQGVAPENLCIYGHSLGGAIGSSVAAYYQNEFDMELGFISDRSFADATDVVNDVFDWAICIKYGLSLLTRFWWNLNAIDEFPFLRGFKGIIYSKQDGVISYSGASLHNRMNVEGVNSMQLRIPIFKETLAPKKLALKLKAHCMPIDAVALKIFMKSWLERGL